MEAATLLTWDVTGTTGTSGSGVASASAIGVSGSAMSAGSGTGAGNISGGTTSPANSWNRNYPATNGTGFTNGATFPYTDASSSMAANLFVTWTTTVGESYTLTVTNFTGLALAKTSTAGPTSAELYYSTNGTDFTKVGGTAAVTPTLTSAAGTFTPASPIVVTGAAGGTAVTWRLVPFNGIVGRMGIGNAGTDNFSILGTVTGGAAKDLLWPGGDGEWTGVGAWLDGTNPATFATNDNVTINGGTITVSSAVLAGSVTVGGSLGTSLGGSGITGTTLAKSGSGTLTLAMANTFSGGAAVTGGVLTVGANGALGSGAVSLDGASVQVLDPTVTSIANGIAVGTNDATVTVGSGASPVLGGVISASGTVAGVARGDAGSFNVLYKSGAGTAVLANSIGSQMSYDTTTKLITTAGAIQLNIAAGGSLAFNGAGKTMNLASGTNADTFDTNTVPPTPITTYNGMVWDGDFYLQAGTVQINGGNIRGNGKIYVAGTGTLAQRLNFNSPDIDNNVDVTTTNSFLTLSAASGGSIKLNGLLTGSGTVLNTGSGGVSLNNTNPSTFTGTFNVVQTSTNSSSRMTVKAQTLASAAGVVFIPGNLPKMTIENSTTTSGAVVACPISGPGELTKAYDGDILLTAENTFSGGLVVQDAGTVYITNASSLGTGRLVAGSVDSRIGLHSSASVNEITITNDVDTWVPIVRTNFTTNGSTIETNVTTTLYVMAFAPGTDTNGAARAIQLNSLVTNGGLLKVSGGGNLFVNNTNNTYSGGTEIGTGAIVIANPAVLSTGPVNFGTQTGSYLRCTADATMTNPITISGIAGTSTNASVVKYTANFSVDPGVQVVLSSPVANKFPVGTNATDQKYGGRVQKWGSGTLVFAGTNTFSEMLELDEGVLVLSNSSGIGATNPVSFNGGTMRLAQSSGDVVAGALTVASNSILDLGSTPARTIRFGAISFVTNTLALTVTNAANGSVYFPTNTSAENLAQIKSAENPTYTAALDPVTGLLSFSAGFVAPTNLSYAPSSVDGVVGVAIPNMTATVTGVVDAYSISPTLPAGLSINATTGVISGTPSVETPATWFTVTATNTAGSTTADVYISVVTPYQGWAAGYGLSGAGALGTSDPDKDGLNNNSEYAFGTDPTVANATLLVTSVSGSNYTVTWIERDSGLTYNVQSTANLATTAFANDGSLVVVTSGNQSGVPSGYTRKQFTVTASGAKYYRVRATP